MLAYCFEEKIGHDILDDSIIRDIVKRLLDPPEEVVIKYSDCLRIELLNLATLLIKHIPERLVNHRKELIKFGWNHLKRDESTCKYYAFINVCQFLDAYQAPEKIILQVYVALLRTCQPDVRRPQVCQALDILVPALPRRMQPGDHRFPVWIRYTKKTLVEEGHSLSHLVHIWQLIVRHPSLFYSSRSQFIPQMVNGLNRLGLPQNALNETRRLALD
jgi:transformation/transcription domain-associated protein